MSEVVGWITLAIVCVFTWHVFYGVNKKYKQSIRVSGIGESSDEGPYGERTAPLCAHCIYHEYRAGRGDAYGAGGMRHICIRRKSVVTGDRVDMLCDQERENHYKYIYKNGHRYRVLATCGNRGQYFKNGERHE